MKLASEEKTLTLAALATLSDQNTTYIQTQLDAASSKSLYTTTIIVANLPLVLSTVAEYQKYFNLLKNNGFKTTNIIDSNQNITGVIIDWS